MYLGRLVEDDTGGASAAADRSAFAALGQEAAALRAALADATRELEAADRRARAAAALLADPTLADAVAPEVRAVSATETVLRRCRALLTDSAAVAAVLASLKPDEPTSGVPPAPAPPRTSDAATDGPRKWENLPARGSMAVGAPDGPCGLCWVGLPSEAAAVAASRKGHRACCVAITRFLYG